MKNGGFYREAERLLNAGYWPIDIKPGEKRPHRSGWSAIRLGFGDIEAINKQTYDPGVGIICGVPDADGWSVVAVDIDVMDETQAGVLVSWCHEFIGDAPERYGRRPKALLVYKYRGELKKAISGGDKGSRVEVLGTGQQFVAYGVHPDTGKEYEWVVPLCGVGDLTEITMDQIEQLFEKWYQLAPEARENLKVRYDSEGNAKYVGKSIPELVMDIIAGNNLHDSLVHLSQQWRYDGISDELIIRDLKGYMGKSAAKNDRPDDWQKRYNDIERIVIGANKRDDSESESFTLDGFGSFEGKVNTLPMPPGLLGQLVDDAYNMALYRYREVAFVSAIGAVAGICGRKFNVACQKPTGLNMYMTLIANTGIGKEGITDFLNHVMYEAISDVGTVSSSFFSDSDYTGPKALMGELKDARSKVVLFSEAGVGMEQKSGDKAGLKKSMLQLYSKSHSTGRSSGAVYSKKEDMVSNLRAPALTVISESPPDSLIEGFRNQGAIESGYLARQSVFRVVGQKPYAARDLQQSISPECAEKLKHLAVKAAAVQAVDDPSAHMMRAENDALLGEILDHCDFCRDKENEFELTNSLKSVMWSRAHVKALRYAGIACVFNRKEAKIFREEWEWATRMVDYEMSCVDSCFAGGGLSGDPREDLARDVIIPVVKKAFENGYKTFSLSKREIEKKMFPKRLLIQVLKNNKQLNKYNASLVGNSKGQSGLEKIIDYMLEQKYIIKNPDTKGEWFSLTKECIYLAGA